MSAEPTLARCRTHQLGTEILALSLVASSHSKHHAPPLPPLVALLGPHSSAEVQERAAGALQILAVNDENKVKIAAAGAIPPLVALLGPHNSAVVQEQAAGAIFNLAFNDKNKIEIVATGAIPPLVALLGPHSSAGLQESAASTLFNLALHNYDNQVMIRSVGGVEALNQLLSSTDENVKSAASDLLSIV